MFKRFTSPREKADAPAPAAPRQDHPTVFSGQWHLRAMTWPATGKHVWGPKLSGTLSYDLNQGWVHAVLRRDPEKLPPRLPLYPFLCALFTYVVVLLLGYGFRTAYEEAVAVPARNDTEFYAGRFEVDRANSTVTHAVEFTTKHSWRGARLTRRFSVHGDGTLHLTTLEEPVVDLVWARTA
mmetsp:Transcript_10211/g.30539  ORF Transcript_10211/g.30539 Transcript_10211/m.30539 type:complete len:181 (+) Transcript_10211:203-745(+)